MKKTKTIGGFPIRKLHLIEVMDPNQNVRLNLDKFGMVRVAGQSYIPCVPEDLGKKIKDIGEEAKSTFFGATVRIFEITVIDLPGKAQD